MLHSWMSALFGQRVNTDVPGGITWSNLGLSCAVVALILIVHGVAVVVIRRKRKPAAHAASLADHALRVLGGPC